MAIYCLVFHSLNVSGFGLAIHLWEIGKGEVKLEPVPLVTSTELNILLLISSLTVQTPRLRVPLLCKTTSFSLRPSRPMCAGLWKGNFSPPDRVTRVKCGERQKWSPVLPHRFHFDLVDSSWFLGFPVRSVFSLFWRERLFLFPCSADLQGQANSLLQTSS